jgi:hypothetical protein
MQQCQACTRKSVLKPSMLAKEYYKQLMKRWYSQRTKQPVHSAIPSAALTLGNMPPLLYPWRYFPWAVWGAAVHTRYDILSKARSQRTQKQQQYAALKSELYTCLCAGCRGDAALRVLLCSSVSNYGWEHFVTQHMMEYVVSDDKSPKAAVSAV